MIREMFEKLNYIKTEGDLMDVQCREIEGTKLYLEPLVRVPDYG